MDLNTLQVLIDTLGFPIVCCGALGFAFWKMWNSYKEQLTNEMQNLIARADAREEKLYKEISECRAINSKAIETLATYAEQLRAIQNDVSDIKEQVSKL